MKVAYLRKCTRYLIAYSKNLRTDILGEFKIFHTLQSLYSTDTVLYVPTFLKVLGSTVNQI